MLSHLTIAQASRRTKPMNKGFGASELGAPVFELHL